jgi:hypothetical protein
MTAAGPATTAVILDEAPPAAVTGLDVDGEAVEIEGGVRHLLARQRDADEDDGRGKILQRLVPRPLQVEPARVEVGHKMDHGRLLGPGVRRFCISPHRAGSEPYPRDGHGFGLCVRHATVTSMLLGNS